MTAYPKMFTPLRIGSIEIKNRVVFGPHVTNHFPGHKADERTNEYYAERARGGVGLVVIGASPVDETADDAPHSMPAVHDEGVIDGITKLAETLHALDTKIFVQLIHPGLHQFPDRLEDHPPARGPSALPTPLMPNYIAHELDKGEILEIEEKFAAAAERMKRAGVDGVELLGINYLINQFLSPLTNKRTDEYGGSTENRARFLVEILDRVRGRVGREFVVGVRVASTEGVPGGIEPSYMADVARIIDQTGQLDYLSVSAGSMHNPGFTIPTHASEFPYGYQADWTARVKEAVGVPVFVAGMIQSPSLVEEILVSGKADACVLVRELIAEPDFVSKAASGESDRIRPCAYWNQDCLGRIMNGLRLECHINAAAGHELRYGSRSLLRKKADVAKRVLIVGAGPAGLELARVAGARGHEVVVYERDATIGGQVKQLVELPRHREIGGWLGWIDRELARDSRVTLKLGSPVEASELNALVASTRADHLVIATGARAARDGRSGLTTEPIAGHDQPHVLSYEDLLSADRLPTVGQRVLIIDELCDRTALGLAERLSKLGHSVTILTRWPAHGFVWMIQWNEIGFMYRMLDEQKVTVIPNSWVRNIVPGRAECFMVYTGRPFDVEADSIVLVTMKYANDALYKAARASVGVPVHSIGDAVAPRHIKHAVHDANRLALSF